MGKALVVRKDHLPRSLIGSRAAQYVRMSTEYQKYSIENQAAVIAAYAHAHNLTIVRTYADRGESGLKLKNRAGLISLIQDVGSGAADFEYILVYDVSRWGRFQDIDESAHYEYLCKQAGLKIVYCAEQFENDGSMLSNVVKNLKRVMAAEYSRELSVKVHTGACRFARLGFLIGGKIGYGLDRVLVDERLQAKKVLAKGDRKYLHTDHVRLKPGPPNEVLIVQWIFARFLKVRSEKAIALELNRRGIQARTGRPWRAPTISRLLRNENYIGNIVYNRQSQKLRGKRVNNPFNLWVRAEKCFQPIVSDETFQSAQKIMRERRVDVSEEEMLSRLAVALKENGRLTPKVINSTAGLPSTRTFVDHFGTLRNAYRLIGYISPRNCDYLDVRHSWMAPLSELAESVRKALEKVGSQPIRVSDRSERTNRDVPEDHLIVNGENHIYFRIAYWTPGERHSFSPFWSMSCRRLPPGRIVAIRLGEHNQSILDYITLPTVRNDSNIIRFRERGRVDYKVTYYKTESALAFAVARLTTSGNCATRTKSRSRTKAASRAVTTKTRAGVQLRASANKDKRRSPDQNCD
jgi:DNA invertase Pin-like site-specific DNA recombinase